MKKLSLDRRFYLAMGGLGGIRAFTFWANKRNRMIDALVGDTLYFA